MKRRHVDTWEHATLGAERPWARAAIELLRNAPAGSTVKDVGGKPVLVRPRKTIAERQAQMRANASRWRVNDEKGGSS
jgi:hypothetical protein